MAFERGPKIQFPWAFGTIVYHVAAKEKVKGIVTGYCLYESNRILVVVTWGDDYRGGTFSPFELTTEFEPSYLAD